MRFRRQRLIQPEILDSQTPERAAPSLRDLVRINRYTGGHRVLLRSLRQVFRREEHFTFLDIGSASGDAADVVLREYPNVRTCSVDLQLHHLRPAPGMRAVADVFRPPIRRRSVDVAYCGLFLHHFEDAAVVSVLHSMGEMARRAVIVNDLERHALAFWFLPLTAPLFQWDPITLHDGPVSVQAAFTSSELYGLAIAAGLRNIRVQRHRPAFRLSMVAQPPDATLAV